MLIRVPGARESKDWANDFLWLLFEIIAFGLMFACMFYVGFTKGVETAMHLQGGS